VLIFAATAILVFAPGSKRGPTSYLVAALALTLVGDISITLLPALFPELSRDGQADRFDGLLLLANSLLAAALVHKDATRMAEPDASREQRLHPARMVFLGISLLVVPTVAGLHSFGSLVSRISLLASIGLLTSLILVRFVLVVREQERIRSVLLHQAEHDQLTGLDNRQALLARLEHALLRAPAGYGPVIFYLDLNGFKQINDRYGHATGDLVLVEFARRLRTGLRPADTAARLGGDEFVVLASEIADDSAAQAFADRLRLLAAEPLHHNGHELKVGVSVGLAAAGPLGRPNADELLAAADEVMYTEKMAGRAESA
jgi:diguanylate cyclase (GGDEF)-like protein